MILWILSVIHEEFSLLKKENKENFLKQEQIKKDFALRIQELQSTLAVQKTLVNRARALASEEIHELAEVQSRVDLLKREWHSLTAKILYVEEMLKASKKS